MMLISGIDMSFVVRPEPQGWFSVPWAVGKLEKWHWSRAKISRWRNAAFGVWPSEVSSVPHVSFLGHDRSEVRCGETP